MPAIYEGFHLGFQSLSYRAQRPSLNNSEARLSGYSVLGCTANESSVMNGLGLQQRPGAQPSGRDRGLGQRENSLRKKRWKKFFGPVTKHTLCSYLSSTRSSLESPRKQGGGQWGRERPRLYGVFGCWPAAGSRFWQVQGRVSGRWQEAVRMEGVPGAVTAVTSGAPTASPSRTLSLRPIVSRRPVAFSGSA